MNGKRTDSNFRGIAKTTLADLLDAMGFEITIEVFEDSEDELLLHVETQDAGRLIGRNAQVLDALQYILNRILHQQDENAAHCTVDIERYRERRKDRLLRDAYDAAEQVQQTGEPYRFAPMKAAERKIVHRALKGRRNIRTYSEEAEDYDQKCLVVCPADD
jgi:spoIIIJ-associated protein